MRLTGLHVLLAYECNLECDHCFVWSGPGVAGVFTSPRIDDVLQQARDAATVDWIYFEGGEPFLYYGLLRHGVRRASELGFRVGVVSNAYWAVTREDARECLRDLAGHVKDLALSRDRFHGDEEQARRVGYAVEAARALGIPCGVIQIDPGSEPAVGQLPQAGSGVMHRGRAAVKLAPRAPRRPASGMNECPYENLREPGRVHLDPFGNLHVCQGIVIGNVFREALRDICARYDPDAHPVVGPMLAGGPLEVARRHGVRTGDAYADACHLCYETREALRSRLPDVLGPAQMYGAS
jgi:MoaA/NifB/PqqE/SkfB family radical SAM enzyme